MRALLVLALALALAPAAEARCLPVAKAAHAKSQKGCRKMPGQRATARAVAQMVAASLQAVETTTAPPPPPDTPPTEPTQPAATRLGVTAREWSLVLSRSVLPAGRALVQLQNFGEDAHNLRIESSDATIDVPLAESGEVKESEGTLPAGDYKLYCTLPGHDAAGMHARLTVSR